jgi:predicted nucleic acid-binding Zn finger protein
MTTTRPTKSEIFTTYNHLRAEARKAGDLKQIERLNKALGILQSKDYYLAEKAEYLPSTEHCGCKDFEYRFSKRRGYAGPCKHQLAEIMIEAIRELRIIAYFEAGRVARHSLESEYRS